jgi:hypothetical protein
MTLNGFRFTRRPSTRTPRQALSSRRFWGATLAVLALAGIPRYANGQTDNFNSGILDPGWVTSVCSNYPGNISFPTDVFGGKALRLAATNTALPNDGDTGQDTPRFILWRTNQSYTNFYVAVDIAGWNASIDRSTNDATIGLLARCKNTVQDTNMSNARPTGLALALRYNRYGGTPQGTRGSMYIVYLQNGGAPSLFGGIAGGGDNFTINPGHTYRMVFTGTNLFDEYGSQTNDIYYGRVYDLQDLTRPLATLFASQPNFPYSYWPTVGYSGLAMVGMGWAAGGDVTFDNFVASAYPPTNVSLSATPYGLAGVPQVVNRSPASWADFYAPTGGITFSATTLNANTISPSDIHLFLNGVDVTSSLVIGGNATNRTVSFPGSGLASNAVYDARIELANNLGQKTTNIWTFDTFSDAYLASASCKNIECEDFDFGAGQFIDNPIVSGYTMSDTFYYNESQVWPWPGAINQGSTAYVDQGSLGDNTVDFFDYDAYASSPKNNFYEADFRPVKSVGTSAGALEFFYADPLNGNFQSPWYNHDTRRQKYVNAGLEEYMLERTEGGEWYNYTRTFDGARYFNVYLRHGCELSQQLRLQQIAGGAAIASLGTFGVTNAVCHSNYRYAPLRDGAGKLAVVNLSGVNTLRLLVDVPWEERTKRGLSLNYLAFVPAVLVESSAQAKTGYTIETNAAVDPGTRRITFPTNGAARFYRLRADHAVAITGFSIAGGNVLLTYTDIDLTGLLVESSAQVNTGYSIAYLAVVDPATKSITIPASDARRFYRLRWDRATTIKSIRRAGGNVVLTYL